MYIIASDLNKYVFKARYSCCDYLYLYVRY